ncbi:DUF397 domain-containing protein [Nocardia sp. ET3-3]|uniref:DUF397 domain-containing protein n=1 Tax=Nocardia terrae TaxID=2675851 RepID=A0A7K1V4M1_9NOCA|nr:DUF397 domain-containing protein [Nocardia terrae]MVU81600.1 DUF397 domain-containing protein [Nocardia terrae]
MLVQVISIFRDQSCVEVCFGPHVVRIRDSKYLRNPANDPHRQPYLTVPIDCWNQFLGLALSKQPGTVALGSLDAGDALTVELSMNGEAVVVSGTQRVELRFTTEEWDAFIKGVADGEFDPH